MFPGPITRMLIFGFLIFFGHLCLRLSDQYKEGVWMLLELTVPCSSHTTHQAIVRGVFPEADCNSHRPLQSQVQRLLPPACESRRFRAAGRSHEVVQSIHETLREDDLRNPYRVPGSTIHLLDPQSSPERS